MTTRRIPKVHLTINLPVEQVERMYTIKDKTGRPISYIVEQALHHGFQREIPFPTAE